MTTTIGYLRAGILTLALAAAGCSEASAKTITSPGASGSGVSANTVLGRAQSKAGATITKCMGSDFDTDTWYKTTLAGSGAVTPSTTDKGGVLSITTGATSGSLALINAHGTINLVDNLATSRWYLVTRLIVTTAINSNARVGTGFFTSAVGNPSIFWGINGGTSTGFFSFRIDNNAGATTDSGITTLAVDTAYHVLESWSNTTTISFAADGTVLDTALASAAGTSAVSPMVAALNGGTAAARTVKVDYMYLCTGEPAL